MDEGGACAADTRSQPSPQATINLPHDMLFDFMPSIARAWLSGPETRQAPPAVGWRAAAASRLFANLVLGARTK
ncbi:hypothetical protein MY3957_004103 [Beauveria namnaoensis]